MSGDEWSTPQWLFDYYNRGYKFNLDAAANKENTKCTEFFSKEDNSLAQSWEEKRVWCNPPYSRAGGPLTAWVAKAIREVKDASYHELVAMLIPADTSTQYFKLCWECAYSIHFWHRIKFVGAPSSAKFGSMVVIFNSQRGLRPKIKVLRKTDIF